jgi:hypothetical protein
MLDDIVLKLAGPAANEAREILRGIRDEVRGLADLAEEYLIGARLPNLKPETGSLNELVTELIGFLQPIADRCAVGVALDLDTSAPLGGARGQGGRPVLRQRPVAGTALAGRLRLARS